MGGTGTLMLHLLTKLYSDEVQHNNELEYLTLECEERLVPFYAKRIRATNSDIPHGFYKSHSNTPDPHCFMYLPLYKPRLPSKDRFEGMRRAYLDNWSLMEELTQQQL